MALYDIRLGYGGKEPEGISGSEWIQEGTSASDAVVRFATDKSFRRLVETAEQEHGAVTSVETDGAVLYLEDDGSYEVHVFDEDGNETETFSSSPTAA